MKDIANEVSKSNKRKSKKHTSGGLTSMFSKKMSKEDLDAPLTDAYWVWAISIVRTPPYYKKLLNAWSDFSTEIGQYVVLNRNYKGLLEFLDQNKYRIPRRRIKDLNANDEEVIKLRNVTAVRNFLEYYSNEVHDALKSIRDEDKIASIINYLAELSDFGLGDVITKCCKDVCGMKKINSKMDYIRWNDALQQTVKRPTILSSALYHELKNDIIEEIMDRLKSKQTNKSHGVYDDILANFQINDTNVLPISTTQSRRCKPSDRLKRTRQQPGNITPELEASDEHSTTDYKLGINPYKEDEESYNEDESVTTIEGDESDIIDADDMGSNGDSASDTIYDDGLSYTTHDESELDGDDMADESVASVDVPNSVMLAEDVADGPPTADSPATAAAPAPAPSTTSSIAESPALM